MSDILHVACPKCSRELKLKDRSLLGKKGKCPGCGHLFVLKEPAAPVELEFAAAPTEDTVEKPVTAPPKPKKPAAKSKDSIAISFDLPDPAPGALPGFPAIVTAPPPVKMAPQDPTKIAVADKKTPLKVKKRRRLWPYVAALGMLVAICGSVGYGLYVLDQTPAAKPIDPAQLKPTAVEHVAHQKRSERPEFTPPVKSTPIELKMLPSGCQFVIHLRPAELWKAGGRVEDVRLCLGPLGKLVEQQMKAMCQFEPAQIEECTIVLMAGPRGTVPDAAIAVHLLEPFKLSQMLDRYGGAKNDIWGYPVYESDKTALVLGGDLKSFGIAPKGYAEALARSMTEPSFASRGIDGLLPYTDRGRLVTLLFDTSDARIQSEQLFSKEARPTVDRFLDFLGEDVETVAWMFHQDEDRFFSDLLVRNATKVAPGRLERELKQKLNEIPKQLVASVSKMQPKTMGRRQLIGRVPAMTKAFAMATEATLGARHVELITPLPAKAGPNLAAGLLLAWDEAQHTDFNRKATPSGTPGSSGQPTQQGGATIAEKIKTVIDVDFRRQPLQEAFAYVADEAKFTLEIDGDALKFSGYTKNMPQTFKYDRQPAEKILAKILQPYDKMCVVIDEAKKVMTVMTYPVAEQRGLKPAKLPAPPE